MSTKNILLTITECAKKLGISESALRKNITRKSNKLPPFQKIGNQYLFWERDVDIWINSLPIVYPNQYSTEPVFQLVNHKNIFQKISMRKGRGVR